jgi:multidrug efflux pump
VQMQAEASNRTTPEQILRIPVRNAQGGMVSLSEFAKPRWVVDLPKLDRFNGLPSMKISGGPALGGSSGQALAAMEEVAAKLPPGFGFEWAGTSREERLSGSQAPFLFGLSVVAVFLCLAALYESWSIPVAVILVVPIGILGALTAVTLRDMQNDVYFKVGLIVIIGLAAKNAILIIQFARDLQDKGHELIDATLEACRLRFRPILMTSIAFVLGVLPLAISTGAGANGRRAIGTGVMGGMIAATVLAVFLVPVFYVVVRRIFPGHARTTAANEENQHD